MRRFEPITVFATDCQMSEERLKTFIKRELLKIFEKFDTHYITFPEIDVDFAGNKFFTTITGAIYFGDRRLCFFDTDINRQTSIQELDLCDLAAKLSDIAATARPLNE